MLRRIIPNVKLNHFPNRLVPIINNITKHLRVVAVRNLNTDLIVGIPGLRCLGIVAHFENNEVKIGDKPIFSIKAEQPLSHICTIAEYKIDPDLTENQHRQMQEITQKWAKKL